MSTRTQGQAAESLACHHLERHGLRLIERNYQCRAGELDLVMRDGPQWVFVEVRSRRAGRHGGPLETVTPRKQQRLLRAAAHYLQRRRIDAPCRFDVIGILHEGAETRIEWIRDAFQAAG